METITNIASTATSTVSNLIYGDQTKKNETEGKEPVSGEQGKGTAADPYDHGNAREFCAVLLKQSILTKILAATPLETTDKKTFINDSSQPTSREPASGEHFFLGSSISFLLSVTHRSRLGLISTSQSN